MEITDREFAQIDQDLMTLAILFADPHVESVEVDATKASIRVGLLRVHHLIKRDESKQREAEFIAILRDVILSVLDDEARKTFEYVYTQIRSALVSKRGLGLTQPIALRARLYHMGWVDTSRRNTVPPARGGSDGPANR